MAKAIISTTYNDLYLWNLPLVTWYWNKLNVDVICFVPDHSTRNNNQGLSETEIENRKKKYYFILDICEQLGLKVELKKFSAPEHKEATYAQCLRNYAACLELPEDELLVTSDVDMALFKIPEYIDNGMFSIFGYDLVPTGQFPQCYVTAPVKAWRDVFNLHGKMYQQKIDELLKDDECEDYRGCRWSVDQEQSFLNISKVNHNLIARARPDTQFASNRVDRDDINWRAYVNDELVDAHLWRPGYAEGNFENIMELLTMKYPDDDFTWLKEYTEQYKKLL